MFPSFAEYDQVRALSSRRCIVHACSFRSALIRALLLAMCVSAAPRAVLGQEQSPKVEEGKRLVVDESSAIELDARALYLAAVALEDFKIKNKNWRCFNVSMYSQGEDWRVDFAPRDDVQRVGENLLVGASKCGKGLSYIVSQAGTIVRVIHAR
jgi:hypothetical protein